MASTKLRSTAPRTWGNEFEDSLSFETHDYFREKKDFKAVETLSGSEMDLYEGSDLKIWGVPVDLTFAFSAKDNMTVISQTVELECSTVKFGVRFGNTHKGFTKFTTPVLVIGVDEDTRFIKMYLERLAESFRRHLNRILEVGFDSYWDTLDNMELAC